MLIIGCLSGCVENKVDVEAIAHRGVSENTGFLHADFQFNITNRLDQDMHDVGIDISFFKINEYEFSKQLVNSSFYANWSLLPSGETKPAFFETSLDPTYLPVEVPGLWDNEGHWQVTFKISWKQTSRVTHVTTRTFNWYFT